ncbi:MAG: adenylate kinase family protein [Patescibacteria group bacterium]
MKKIISLYGLAAAGKTTQADLLCEKYGFRQFGMGETLRAEIESGSELGQEIKKSVDAGVLIPDDLMKQVLKKIDAGIKETGLVFDGFPRMIPQAKMLDQIMSETAVEFDLFILLNISYEEAQKRISDRAEVGGRADDKDPKVVNSRLDVFRKESSELIAYYKEKGKFVEIDGTLSIPEVFAEIEKHL